MRQVMSLFRWIRLEGEQKTRIKIHFTLPIAEGAMAFLKQELANFSSFLCWYLPRS